MEGKIVGGGTIWGNMSWVNVLHWPRLMLSDTADPVLLSQ